RLISIGNLVKKEKLYSGMDKKRDTFIADMKKLSERIKKIMADSNGDLIIEGHYATDLIAPEEIKYAFVLRRDPHELKIVLEKRGYKKEKVQENLAAEILDVCLYDAIKCCGVDKVCEIDVTGRRIEDIVEEILLVLNGKKKCEVGIVDWLGKLEYEGKLDEYLEHF
ncbi:MAG: AAA family ATPase, partial [Candidatus Bathyarchaeia archaeon]